MPEKNTYESNIEKLPPATRAAANSVWENLSPADRQAILDIVQAFPSRGNMIQLFLRLATNQIKTTFGRKHRVAIVGPTNVGKSTLYNQLVQSKEDLAAVSPLPGTTRQNALADAGLFTLVDTPGADAVGEVGQREQQMALDAAADADFLIIVFDAIQGIKRTEMELFEHLRDLGKPYIVVMNKIDLARREQKQIIEGAANTLGLQPEQVIPIIARTGQNLDDVLVAIAMTEPAMVAALGQALPQYRWQLAWRSIVSAASASAVVALTPLPMVDFLPLTALQGVMVLGIARIYNYEITPLRARELIATFGLGFLGRTLFRQLSKFGGVPGWLLSSAIAAATTIAMGYAASVWFESGEKVSADELKKITSTLTNTLLARLKTVGKRKPSKETLQQEIEQALNEIPLAEDRETLRGGTEAPAE